MLWLLLASTLLWNGCRLARETAAMPQRTVQAVTGTTSKQPDPAVLQLKLMRYADDSVSRINRTVEDFVARPETTQEEIALGMRARLAHSRTLIGLATGPNPNVALLDLISMASLTRMSLDTAVTDLPDGNKYQPMLETALAMETNVWAMAGELLKPEQQQELRTAIEDWYRDNARPERTVFSRPQEFATGIRKAMESGSKKDGGFFSMLTLDPMAGLDPAVREVTETRLFAERALFAAQHAPRLLRWEIELLTWELSHQPEMQTLLSNSTSLTASLDRASRTAAELPDRITSEREAILSELKDQEGQLVALSAEIKQTLEAGGQMSTSLNTTITTFDGLMKRFGVGEPKPEKAADPNAKPFDILDYAQTAEHVAGMADQLHGVLTELNATLDSPALDTQIAKLNDVSARTAAEVKDILTHATLLVAGLIALTILGVLVVRRVGSARKG